METVNFDGVFGNLKKIDKNIQITRPDKERGNPSNWKLIIPIDQKTGEIKDEIKQLMESLPGADDNHHLFASFRNKDHGGVATRDFYLSEDGVKEASGNPPNVRKAYEWGKQFWMIAEGIKRGEFTTFEVERVDKKEPEVKKKSKKVLSPKSKKK